MRDLDLTSLRLFVTVCDTGNMSRAAEKANMVASAVSKRLAQLEATVGASLLTRRKHGVVPTRGLALARGIGVRRRWGVLFQGGALFSTLTVGENVEVALRKYYPELSPQLRAEIARYKVILTGLPESAVAKFPSELSGGMKKRAGLARALALDPELLFLDEPTAGLDPIGAAKFDRLTRELQETLGLTVFLITHDLDTLYEICDRVAVIAEKKIIAVGTIPELIATGHPWIEEYFGGPRGRAAHAAHLRGEA